MITDQLPLKSDKTEASFVVDLKRKPAQELRRFMAGPWTASILSSEEIEDIYQRLQQKEVASLDETEENFVEIGLD
jgi:hypothetical protein